MDYNNNNNNALADKLDSFALQLSSLEVESINESLEATEKELSQIDRIAQEMEAPSLRAITHWMILNIEQDADNEAKLRALLTEGAYFNWLEVLAALLRNHDKSLLHELYVSLTSPKWLIKPSIPLLKDLAKWVESSKVSDTIDIIETENITTNDSLEVSENTTDSLDEEITNELSDDSHEDKFQHESYEDNNKIIASKIETIESNVFEEIDVNLLQKEYTEESVNIVEGFQDESNMDSPLIEIDKSGSYDEFEIPNNDDLDIISKDIDVIDVDVLAEIENHATDNAISIDIDTPEEISESDNSIEALDEEINNDFNLEIDDIIMSLITISSTSEDVFNDADKFKSELQRLNMLAEINNYPAIANISSWCQQNINLFAQQQTDESKQFMTSGESWGWLEVLNICLAEPEEFSHLSTLSVELIRDEWAQALPMEDLQSLLLFLKNPQNENSAETEETNTLENAEDTATSPICSDSDTANESQLSMKWNEDIHPELLEAYFEETPDLVTELVELLQKVSKEETSKEEQHKAARIAHTIKGGSAVVGITALSTISYEFEKILDYSVNNQLSKESLELLLESSTCLEQLFEAVIYEKTEPQGFANILAKLTTYSETLEEDEIDLSIDLAMPSLPDFITQPAPDLAIDELEEETQEEVNNDVEAVEATDDDIQAKPVQLATLEDADDINDFSAELDDITMSLLSIVNSPEEVFNHVDEYAGELQRLELLAEISGHQEIAKTSQWCQQNLALFSQSPTDEIREFISSGESWSWVELISAVLADPEEITHLSMLTSLLMREEWIEAMPMADLQTLLLSLKELEQKETTEEEPYAEIDTPSTEESTNANDSPNEIISWDADIHPELLSVYLQETPDQVSEVAMLLHKISKGEADTEDHQNAARIAHTIKGASGVVGINSLVEITHKLEDILDYSVKNELPEEVSDLLAESSDSLEDLFEAIQNKQAEPAEFAPVLAKLSQYAETLDGSTITDDSLLAFEAPELPDYLSNEKSSSSNETEEPDFSSLAVESDNEQQAQPETKEQVSSTVESHIRVPLRVIDRLLNLAGELVTTSSQVTDKITDTLSTGKQIKSQDKRVHKMLEELSATISKQEKDQFNMLSSLKDSDFDTLEMDTYNELHSIAGLLTESILDNEEIGANIGKQLHELDDQLRSLEQLNKELSEVILRSRMVSINTLTPRLERIVRQTCRKTNKKAELIVTGNEINVDTDILNGLTDPLLHLLRNSIDHGIESSESRKENNKAETGQVHLEFSREGNFIQMQLKDDGAGIDADKIFEKAVEKGLITSDQELSKREKLELILLAGFTTQENVTDISGRGVGMDVVNNAVESLKGTLEIDSDMGEGTTFTIKIPLTLVTSATLLVSIAGNKVAIPSDSIEQLYYLSPELIIEEDNGQYIRHNGEKLLIQSLATLLDWPSETIDFSKANTLLLIKGANETHAVYIDEIIYSREVVVKSLSDWLASSKGLIGACHLPDGGVAPVINLPQILSLNEKTNKAIKHIQTTASEQVIKEIPQILVVDDSLSNRKALSLIIEQTEYDVVTAVDGLDALHIMNEKPISMVFTDLEMPRMNGLELTQAIRAWDDKKAIPVVMITSRTTNKHRELAEKVGVDDYLTKPVVTETLLDSLHHWLKKASLESVK